VSDGNERTTFLDPAVLDLFIVDTYSLPDMQQLWDVLPHGLSPEEVYELGRQVSIHALQDSELGTESDASRAEDNFLFYLGQSALATGDMITAGSVRIHLSEELGLRGKCTAVLMSMTMLATASKNA
jgi:hypothetical protein